MPPRVFRLPQGYMDFSPAVTLNFRETLSRGNFPHRQPLYFSRATFSANVQVLYGLPGVHTMYNHTYMRTRLRPGECASHKHPSGYLSCLAAPPCLRVGLVPINADAD